jgi:hypothetical protein
MKYRGPAILLLCIVAGANIGVGGCGGRSAPSPDQAQTAPQDLDAVKVETKETKIRVPSSNSP